jgi:hypothetical protein
MKPQRIDNRRLSTSNGPEDGLAELRLQLTAAIDGLKSTIHATELLLVEMNPGRFRGARAFDDDGIRYDLQTRYR